MLTLVIQNRNHPVSLLFPDYIGTEKIEAKLDSIKTLQTGFIMNYLIHDKKISAKRFRVFSTAPDTIRLSGNYPIQNLFYCCRRRAGMI
jgi:hypothetical protein